jgi:hypothetical protein
MKIGIMGDDMDSFYRKRAIIYKTFAPSNDTSSIKLTYGTTERQIDCHCIEIAEGNRNYLWQEYVLSFKANDPTWYDPTLNVRTFNLSGGADKMEVPTVIPMTVGASSINAYETIVLEGDVQTFPRIRIHGPITGPVITNVRTDDKLDFSGTTISAGNYYDIDCRYGYKTVEDQDGTNQISNLSNDSDIATFSFIVEEPLESWGKLNSINVTGTGCTDATQITIRYYDRFLGV